MADSVMCPKNIFEKHTRIPQFVCYFELPFSGWTVNRPIQPPLSLWGLQFMYSVHKNSVHTSRSTNSVSIINSKEVKLFESTITLTGLPNPEDEGTSQTSTVSNNAEHKILQQHLECRNPCLFWQPQGTNNTLWRRNAKRLNFTVGGTHSYRASHGYTAQLIRHTTGCITWR
jgi:hypothetical protein